MLMFGRIPFGRRDVQISYYVDRLDILSITELSAIVQGFAIAEHKAKSKSHLYAISNLRVHSDLNTVGESKLLSPAKDNILRLYSYYTKEVSENNLHQDEGIIRATIPIPEINSRTYLDVEARVGALNTFSVVFNGQFPPRNVLIIDSEKRETMSRFPGMPPHLLFASTFLPTTESWPIIGPDTDSIIVSGSSDVSCRLEYNERYL